MKKKFWSILLLMSISLFISCGDDDDTSTAPDNTPPTVTNIELSKQNVEMTYGGTEIVYCNNVNATECDIEIEDDYVVSVSTSKNAINISSRHVGKTKVIISKNGSTKTVEVIVRPTVNIIDIPYIAFGATREEIKSYYPSSEIYQEDENTVVIHKTSPFLYYDYYLKDGKAYKVVTNANTSYSYSKFQELMKEYASEYGTFKYTQSGSGVKETGYIYKRGDDYYIGIRQYTGNFKGFYVMFSKDIDQVDNYQR